MGRTRTRWSPCALDELPRQARLFRLVNGVTFDGDGFLANTLRTLRTCANSKRLGNALHHFHQPARCASSVRMVPHPPAGKRRSTVSEKDSLKLNAAAKGI